MDVREFVASSEPWAVIRGSAIDVLKRLPAESVDAFVTDPPYGIDLQLKWHRKRPATIAGDRPAEAIHLWRAWLPLAAIAARPDSGHFIFGTWKSPWMHRLLSRSFKVKGCVCWAKSQWGLGYYLQPRWELAYLAHKGKPARGPKADCDLWECPRPTPLRHPCEKPVDLLRRAIRLVCPPELRDPARPPLIVDPFAGICSTGVAARLEGCRFLGIELNANYVKLGRRRLANVFSD